MRRRWPARTVYRTYIMRSQSKAQKHGWIVLEAYRLAASGEFAGCMSIEAHIRLHSGLSEVREVLADPVLRRKLEDICKSKRAARPAHHE